MPLKVHLRVAIEDSQPQTPSLTNVSIPSNILTSAPSQKIVTSSFTLIFLWKKIDINLLISDKGDGKIQSLKTEHTTSGISYNN